MAENSEQQLVDSLKREPWTAYERSLWTGTDPETHGDELLAIYKPRGIGSGWRREHAHFIVAGLSEYVAGLHNLAREYGGIEGMRAALPEHGLQTCPVTPCCGNTPDTCAYIEQAHPWAECASLSDKLDAPIMQANPTSSEDRLHDCTCVMPEGDPCDGCGGRDTSGDPLDDTEDGLSERCKCVPFIDPEGNQLGYEYDCGCTEG